MRLLKQIARRPANRKGGIAARETTQHFETFREKLMAKWPHGKELCDMMKAEFGPRVLLKFSGGKDSIAAALVLQEHFDEIVPLHLYTLPGLSFVEEAMDYYSRKLFGGRPILQGPHPRLFRFWQEATFMDPASAAVASAINCPIPEFEDLNEFARVQAGLPDDALAATGVRYSETAIRAQSIYKLGPVMRGSQQWFPIWEYSKQEVFDLIAKHDVALPGEYEAGNKSFDGLHVGYLMPIRQKYPEDYRKICEWFPLIEAEMWRYERHGIIPERYRVMRQENIDWPPDAAH